MLNQACLGAHGTPAHDDRVKMFSCDPNDKYQPWACQGEMLKLKNINLKLHYISSNDRVTFKTWTGQLTKWNMSMKKTSQRVEKGRKVYWEQDM